ncbi:exopolysaccharide biosynthesis protein [Seohaeicola nanhaiensis]|uniref:Exopolysaccharide biosynthesis protein n=1 Tax=Seohaeicola nanhaiensis TaxID=1387282 RepID=A0ABV9KKK3_9RHOB
MAAALETDSVSSVNDVLDRLRQSAHGEKTGLNDIVEGLGHGSFVPVLIAPALLVVSPLSGIPLVSTLCGMTVALVAVQMFFGRNELWLPGWLMRRSVSTEKLKKAVQKMRKPARWIDRHIRRRLTRVVSAPFDRVIHLVCLLCGAAMPVLELVPFTSSILGAAIVLFSITLLVKDGLLGLFAYALTAAAGVVGYQVV